MADEILVWGGSSDERYGLVCFFPIATPTQVGSPPRNVVPTPAPRDDAGALVDWALEANDRDPQLIADLDAGALAFEVVSMKQAPGLSAAQLRAEAQRVYATAQAEFDRVYPIHHRWIGTWLDAT